MNWKDLMIKFYDAYLNSTDTECTKAEFIADEFFELTTYDSGLSIEFGATIIQVIKVIYNKTNHEYIRTRDNYIKYILVCNLIKDWLEWGMSIRGAWFNYYQHIELNQCCIYNAGYVNGIQCKLSSDFIEALIWFYDEYERSKQ